MPLIAFLAVAVITFAAIGCQAREGTPGETATSATRDVSVTAPAGFINRVWVVDESEQVSRGSLRVFLSEGTLVMASPSSTPAFGTWTYETERLSITEEGRPYEVDILELTAQTFRIRIHSPGDPVVIGFIPAEQSQLPR